MVFRVGYHRLYTMAELPGGRVDQEEERQGRRGGEEGVGGAAQGAAQEENRRQDCRVHAESHVVMNQCRYS